MIPNNFSQYNSQSYPRPDDFVDPKEKQNKPDWCHMYAEYIYSQYMNGSSAITQSVRDRMEKRIKYAEGRQDTDIYKNRLLNKTNARPVVPTAGTDIDGKGSTEGKREGYANINFDEVFSPIPKYLDNIMGILSSQDYDIKVDAIDEHSGSLRQELKFMLLAKKQLLNEMQLFNKAFSLKDNTEDVPLPASV